MTAKKNTIMSLHVDPDTQDKIKAHAKKRNISASRLIRDLVDKNLGNVEDEVDTVIFKVPSSAKKDFDTMRSWFLARIDAVSKAVVGEQA
jgi:hypothetical protein